MSRPNSGLFSGWRRPMDRKSMWRSVLVLALSGAAGCSDAQGGEVPDLGPPAPAASIPRNIDINPRILRRFRPLHAAPDETVTEVALGKLLFFDPRLSHDGDLSCNSCHPLDRGGTDLGCVLFGFVGLRGL